MKRYVIYCFLILLFSSLGAYLKFADNLDKTPIGCDEFGYMQLAKAMDNGNTFNSHTPRTYLPDLLKYLRSNGVTEQELKFTVVPHAYYVLDQSNTVINQYAPATSFLLSLVPIAHRKLMFSFIAMFLLLALPLFAFYAENKKPEITLAHLALVVFAFFALTTPPLITELTRINSVMFTIGFLLVAGFFVDTKPLLTCFLIALTANFRQVNLLLLIPMPFFFNIPFPNSLPLLQRWLGQAAKCIGVVFVALIPYFIYMFLLTGNPFQLSYSSIDTKATLDIWANMRFYFNVSEAWFWLNLSMVAVLILMYFKNRASIKNLFGLLLFEVVVYLFFLFHSIQINYYPYAGSMVLFGFMLRFLFAIPISKKATNLVLVSTLLISIIMLIDGGFNSKKWQTVEEANLPYRPFCQYHVVWGDLLPSACEYVCENSAFKYSVTTPKTRKLVIEFMYQHGYSQVFLLQDIPLPVEQVLQELASYKLPIAKLNDDNFGPYLLLKPND